MGVAHTPGAMESTRAKYWAFGLLALGLGVASACGGNTESDRAGTGGSNSAGTAGTGGAIGGTPGSGGATGGTGNAGGSGGIDCSQAGCAQAPMCDVGCTDPCGCCPCAEGDVIHVDGGSLVCHGGCYSFIADDAGSGFCGGLIGAQCPADSWCDLPNGCGFPDAPGQCKKKPLGCDADCPGVCGCDGNFYCNECVANAQGIDTSGDTSCFSKDAGVGTGCQNDGDCNSGLLCCYPCGIPGCQNQCMQPDPNGGCPMFQ
jgi:hypothetical protein